MDLSFLRGVSKPTRYTGGEVNEVVKEDREGLFHVALAFPDAYDIGMSYLGLQILYGKLNAREGLWAERCFMPMPDMERALAERGLPLYALESKRPLSAFDLVGFSLVFELSYTNVLHMLRLGGIPGRASERGPGDPVVIAGGPCAVNPEPLADFVDAFFLGEAEEGFPEVCDLLAGMREAPRGERLRALAGVRGMYVPSLYRTEAEPTSGMTVVTGPLDGAAPFPVPRRAVWDLDDHPFPSRTLVPLHEVVHDRFSVEIARGCSAGCRFCQAGFTYRPYRERSAGSVRASVSAGLAATGFNEVTLLSLNAGDYAGIGTLASEVAADGARQRAAVSMPSLRASSVTRDLVRALSTGRKSGFTIAPEAGTARLRDVINKNVAEGDILGATSAVFSSGWNLVKLYFMLGLPTETDADVEAIADLAGAVVRTAREAGNRKAQVKLSTSSFVPKPFTPFQWRPMERPGELAAKQATLKQLLRRPVAYKWHDVRSSVVEALLSSGDRRLGAAIERAAELGCRLDAWTEHFRYDLWERALAESGVDLDAYIHRERGRGERLPWDHIDMGVRKDFLWREWERALAAEPTPACGPGSCEACADFSRRCLSGEFERGGDGRGTGDRHAPPSASASPCSPTHPPTPSPSPSSPQHPITPSPLKYRMMYAKRGASAFLGHLDLVGVMVRALRRAEVHLAYSQGFHPMPRVEPAAPLPLGVEGLSERMDLRLLEPPGSDLLQRLNALLPRGLEVVALVPLRARDLPLSAFTLQRYAVGLSGLTPEERREVADRAGRFWASTSWTVERASKGATKTVDLRARVVRLERTDDRLAVDVERGGFMDLVEILAPGPERERLTLVREDLLPDPSREEEPVRRPQSLQDAFEASGGPHP